MKSAAPGTYYESHKETMLARSRKYYNENKEKIRLRKKQYRKQNREKGRIAAQHYRAENLEKERRRQRNYQRSRRYGMALIEFENLLRAQNNVCAICKNKERSSAWSGGGPHVDHNHVTGKVRGILCANCNHALGHIGDNPQIARAMADYLETSS